MLVLRKEIKIGIGAGLTILGIAAVYGLMATISSNGTDNKELAANVATDEAAARQKALESSKEGLPPTPDEAVKPFEPKARDPFAESNRTDGNTQTDPWGNGALMTGRLNVDSRTPAVTRAPVSAKPDSKLVTPVSSGSDTGTTVTPADYRTTSPVKSPAKKTTNSAPATPVAGGSKYVIQAGDTFSTISAKVYGSKRYYTALAKANPDVNPSRLRIGHEISVPPKESVATVGGSIETEPSAITMPIDTTRQYRVANGDTLSRIASKLYGKSTMWMSIYEANKTAIGPDAARLKVGTLLELPQTPARATID